MSRSEHLAVVVLCFFLGLFMHRGAAAQEVCLPATTLKTTVQLAWTAPQQPPGITTTGYLLDRQRDSEGWIQIATPGSGALTFGDSGLVPGHTYWYRLRATGTVLDGSTGISGYATNGTPAPCVTLTVVANPIGLSAQPQ